MDYRAHLRQRLLESDVPLSLHAGLVEYFAERRPTGGFLQAVLENNLRQACARVRTRSTVPTSSRSCSS